MTMTWMTATRTTVRTAAGHSCRTPSNDINMVRNAGHRALRRRVRGGPQAHPRGARGLPARQRRLRLEGAACDLERRSHERVLQYERPHLRGPRAVESALAILRSAQGERLVG